MRQAQAKSARLALANAPRRRRAAVGCDVASLVGAARVGAAVVMMATGRRQLLRVGRVMRGAAAAMTVALAAGLVSALPAQADPPNSSRLHVKDNERTVSGKNLKVRPRTSDPATKPGPAARATWPKPGTAQVTVSGDRQAAGRAAGRAAQTALVRAGNLPVWVGAPGAQPGKVAPRPDLTGRVKVEVLDRETARRAGVEGLMVALAPGEGATAGRVGVRLDYSSLAQAFGAAYGTRLRLVQLPACALTTPNKPECRTPTLLVTTNNAETKTLTAAVDTTAPTAVPSVLAAVAAPEGSQGDYKATTLGASATWKVSGNTGDFTWSYPMRLPPVPGGLSPSVELGYSAQSVDGRTGNTNGQPSWAGEGFDLSQGFIERRYKSCEDDGAPNGPGGKPPGDLCWGYDNAVVTWNGKGGELVKAADNTWRLKNDDGTRFRRIVSRPQGDGQGVNGDNDGEYWEVTTTDGTRYYFGLNQLPGYGSGGVPTNSAWTVPVFGDDAGGAGPEDDEPCYKSTGFADSWCQQAWRWNLDLVVDPNDNAIAYFYDKETNHYGRNLKPADATPYTRGGYLKSIEYGLRGGNVFAGAPPAKVVLENSERCIPDKDFDCAPSKISTNADKWWDVPWDMNCEAGTECTGGHGSTSPTFWSRKRLIKVTTQFNRGAGWGYRNVDSWALDHQWGAVNDERDLLIKEIQHTGLAGPTGAETVALPKVTFNHVPKANRLDQAGDGIPPYTRYRVSKIFDESGGEIDISYSGVDCSRSAPPTPESNSKRCYPSIWHLPGQTTPFTDWFNKYVVTSVVQKDRTGHAPDIATRYEYIGAAGWHFDDDDGLTREKFKTWSQWRGYGQVRVQTGDFDNPSTQTDTYYLRGMHGDRATPGGGAKDVKVSDGEGGTHADAEALDGFVLKTVNYTGVGGTVHDKTVSIPWRHQTASRTRSWGTVTANNVQVDNARTWTAMDGGTWRQTKITSDFETDFAKIGRVKQVADLGDVTLENDDKCTRTTYADNLDKWMVAYPSRVETVAVACSTDPDRSKQVISDVQTYYDNGGFGDAPTKGDATKSEKIADHDGSSATYVTDAQTGYDGFGRPQTVTDAAEQTTTTRYTETAGLTTRTVTTSPPATPGNPATALTTTQDLDPAWGLPTVKLDANNLRTDLLYDALGRMQKVWLPNRSKTDKQTPNFEFGYRAADGQQVAAVTTKTLTNSGEQRSTIELYDGWLRSRQTQLPGPEGRLITDTFYDARGKVAKKYAAYSATGAPEPTLFGVDSPGNVETQTHYSYDGLGRQTVERLLSGNGSTQEKWRTTTTYGGNWKAIDPPVGGTPTAEITDARGQVVERRQYQGDGPSGAYDATVYGYDPAGHLTTIKDPTGHTWTNTYDLRGRKTKASDPDTGTTTFTYDDLDRLRSSTDARDKTIFHDYDGLGRKTQKREGSAGGRLLASWNYDSATRGKGLLSAATRHGQGGDYTSQVPGYDVLGRPESAITTIPVSEGALAGSYTFAQSYNLDGTPKDEILPAVGDLPKETVTHTYDAYLRPTRLTSDLATYVGATDYTPTGKPKMIELGTAGKRAWNTLTWEYGTQRLDTSRTYRENIAGNDRNATYQYDPAGNILKISDVSTAGTDTQCFRYDHLRRLTDAWTVADAACPQTPSTSAGPAPYRIHYTYKLDGSRKKEDLYDTSGNRTSSRDYHYRGDPDAGGSVKGHMLGGVDQSGNSPFTGPDTNDETYTYDAMGNPTTRQIGSTAQTLDWTSEAQLEKVTDGGSTTSFVYDADGSRLIRKDLTGATLYLPGTELRATKDANSAVGTRYYTHNGQTVAMRDATGLRYLTGDHQGTSEIAVNAGDQKSLIRRFTPFGQERGATEEDTWPGDKGFVGGTKDPTGLTHLGAREYDPDIGRFISADPVINFENPQQMNGYAYAQNNPATDSDPNGLCSPDGGCATNPCHPEGGHCGGASDDGGCYGNPECLASGKPESTSINPKTCDASCRAQVARTWMKQAIEEKRRAELRALLDAFMHEKDPTRLDQLYKSGQTPPLAGEYVDPREAESGWQKVVNDLLLDDASSCATKSSIMGCVNFYSNFIPEARGGAQGGKGLIRLLKNLRKCSSFMPGTLVLMADGSYKPIEDIEVGDKVIATDPDTGQTSVETVLYPITSEGKKELVQIKIDSIGAQQLWTPAHSPATTAFKTIQTAAQGDPLVATAAHPFWVAGGINDWIEAKDLKPGMWLRTSAGTYTQITAIKTREVSSQRVHNLTVTNIHTYYVVAGATPVLVHNAPCRTFSLRNAPTGPGVYEIVFNNGMVYVGSSETNIHARLHRAFTDRRSAVNAARLGRNDIASIHVSSLRNWSWEDIQFAEQEIIDAYGGLRGGRLLNRRNEMP